MTDILEEVLNEAKEEKRLSYFYKFFPKVIIATVIIAIIIALYSWWDSRKVAHNQKTGDALLQLVGNEQEAALAQESLDNFVKTSGNNQVELAVIKKANDKIASNASEAMAEFEQIAENRSYQKITTSYAKIMWLNLLLDKKELSEADQAKANNYIQSFSDESVVFFDMATLLKGLFYQKQNQPDLAKESAEKLLQSETASPILKEQARALISAIELSNYKK